MAVLMFGSVTACLVFVLHKSLILANLVIFLKQFIQLGRDTSDSVNEAASAVSSQSINQVGVD